jgi:hypothetical protein
MYSPRDFSVPDRSSATEGLGNSLVQTPTLQLVDLSMSALSCAGFGTASDHPQMLFSMSWANPSVGQFFITPELQK